MLAGNQYNHNADPDRASYMILGCNTSLIRPRDFLVREKTPASVLLLRFIISPCVACSNFLPKMHCSWIQLLS